MEVRDVQEWDDFEMSYWWLKANPDSYKTLIIDTMSQLQQVAISKILADKQKDDSRAGDWGTMTKREWGDVAALMKTWILNLRDLPMNVVFIAQDRVFNMGEDEDTEGMLDPEVGPALSPSVMKHLNAAVHVIGNTFIRRRTFVVRDEKTKKKKEKAKTEFCLRIGPNPVYITKVRKPKLVVPPSILVNPSYQAIINLIKGVE